MSEKCEVIGIRFKEVGKIYFFDPDGEKYTQGSYAIVETSRGTECGEVVQANHEVDAENVVMPLKKVIRPATADDLRHVEDNKKAEKDAFVKCEERIAAHGLEMKLVDVEYTFDNSKVIFYFTADGRVDFRELVKDLASVFRTRIELRQIGVRDEAKMLGGIGICGRPFCCSSFLGEFIPVSVKMAKEQGLSLNPTKISGTCGRLMCCLKYEDEVYCELIRKFPRVGNVVRTPDGEGVVTGVELMAGTVSVRISGDEAAAPKTYDREDVKILKRTTEKEGKEEEKLEEELQKELV